jgi:CxxC motif-containing protein (DUF1111 family)
MRKLAKHWVRRLTVGQVVVLLLLAGPLVYVVTAQESAPGEPRGPVDDGFLTTTNGFLPADVFKTYRTTFSSRDKIADGLGPVYNAQSCSDCHQNPITGGGSQVMELRAGRFKDGIFDERLDGSLIQDRAINAMIQEQVFKSENVRSRRISLSTLGDGYIEAIADSNIRSYRNGQPPEMQGYVNEVPVLEAPGATRVGRFGWKAQHASLLSFSAEAYRNEIGITSRLFPQESLSNEDSVASFDQVADPEDKAIAGAFFGADVHKFADFIRSTQHPMKLLPFSADAAAGELRFQELRCSVCHRQNYTTADPGTIFNPNASDPSGQFIVDSNLGGQPINPYSDFLLHDVGTGDNIQQGAPETLNRFRTPPLWGLRARNRLMHDGASLTPEDAILRHAGQATVSVEGGTLSTSAYVKGYKNLTAEEKAQLLAFLASI